MPLDPDVRAYLSTLADGPDLGALSLAELRAAVEGITASCAPAPEVAEVRDLSADTAAGPVPVRLYHPAPGTVLPMVLYFHGGGWMSGSIGHMDPVCRKLAREAEAVVLNVGYRLAPEHPFPAALDDARAVTAWAAAHARGLGGDAGRLVVAGDSAGANLATVVAMLARRDGGPGIAHQLLVCPALDPRMDTPSYRRLADGYVCTRRTMELCWRTYLDRPHGPLDDAPALAAPALAPARDLEGLPPATVLTMEYDPLCDEGEEYAARLAVAGVPVAVHRCPGVIHSALHLDGVAPATAQVRARAVAALRSAFGAAPSVPTA
ncbi:alpha/beta hydrolase [Streptomyces sp. HB2AG]|uniref:alpha/beta hydrolase n=1 Tax=Streptomyces sp. HB2AG TaxID=2983400 RepID=UPI0022AA58E5|nr:alpha/beta hydrolase [Streptomyces sp. HB2AG]MCZ2523489.1 alpha/beta hydrolase [Streptomyces sp. HB2AG]